MFGRLCARQGIKNSVRAAICRALSVAVSVPCKPSVRFGRKALALFLGFVKNFLLHKVAKIRRINFCAAGRGDQPPMPVRRLYMRETASLRVRLPSVLPMAEVLSISSTVLPSGGVRLTSPSW